MSGELDGPIENLVALLRNIDIVICCVAPAAIKSQVPLVDAAAKAGVKRFVPCNWGVVAPPGILPTHDVKEIVHGHIFRQHLGFTIIDVGFWYQASIPTVPSGRFDKAIFMPTANQVFSDGAKPSMHIDARDIGRITVEVLKHPGSLNKRIIAYGEVMSQNETHKLIEDKAEERLVVTHV